MPAFRKERSRDGIQLDKPIASFQLSQVKLAEMATQIDPAVDSLFFSLEVLW